MKITRCSIANDEIISAEFIMEIIFIILVVSNTETISYFFKYMFVLATQFHKIDHAHASNPLVKEAHVSIVLLHKLVLHYTSCLLKISIYLGGLVFQLSC